VELLRGQLLRTPSIPSLQKFLRVCAAAGKLIAPRIISEKSTPEQNPSRLMMARTQVGAT
jgi:hypothetical protein